MSIIIAYTVNKHHNDVKSELEKQGFQDFIVSSSGIKCNLPNTTLCHPNLTHALESRENFKNLVNELNKNYAANDKIEIRHLITINVNGWAAIVGDEHS